MESNEELRAQQHEAERGEAAPWLAYSKPRWVPPAFGLWAGAYTLNFGLGEGSTEGLVSLGLVVLLLAYIVWESRVRPAPPIDQMPHELKATTGLLVVGALVLVGVVLGIEYLTNTWGAAAAAVVGGWLLLEVYGRSYEAATDRVRRRLP